jgi:hypothetical protein
LLPLTKIVLYVWSDGTCSLLTVPMTWEDGQPLPDDVVEERFESAEAAMSVLADLGRSQIPAMQFHRPDEPPPPPLEAKPD